MYLPLAGLGRLYQASPGTVTGTNQKGESITNHVNLVIAKMIVSCRIGTMTYFSQYSKTTIYKGPFAGLSDASYFGTLLIDKKRFGDSFVALLLFHWLDIFIQYRMVNLESQR